jgi:hypothetical protein
LLSRVRPKRRPISAAAGSARPSTARPIEQAIGVIVSDIRNSAVVYQVDEFTRRRSCSCATGPKTHISRRLIDGLTRRPISIDQAPAVAAPAT